MSLPTISVITPCLNALATLPATLDSIRQQTYPDVQLVVVDGGSTDGTVEYLRETEAVWLSEPDGGLSDAVNKGLQLATGDVVGWLNADDEYLPGALRAAGQAFMRPEVQWVTGRCPIVDNDGQQIRPRVTAYKNRLLHHYSYAIYLTQNFISCPATFVRRSAWLDVGPLDVSLRYSMDYDLFLRLARRSAPVILDQDLATFRMVEGTLSMTGFEKQFDEHAAVAARHGRGYPLSVAANRLISRGIVGAYTTLRWRASTRRR